VAFLAVRANWSYGDVMDMEHSERRSWVQEIVQIAQPEKGS